MFLLNQKERRFDLQVEGGRIFSLQAETDYDYNKWSIAFLNCKSVAMKPLDAKIIGEKFWKPEFQKEIRIKEQESFLMRSCFSYQLHASEIRMLNSFFEAKEYNANKVIFNKGDTDSIFYMVLNGQVNILYEDKSSNESILDEISSMKLLCTKTKGDFISLSSLHPNKGRIVSCIAQTNCELLQLTSSNLDKYLLKKPSHLQFIEKIIGKNLTYYKSLSLFNNVTDLNLRYISLLLEYQSFFHETLLYEKNDVKNDTLYLIIKGIIASTSMKVQVVDQLNNISKNNSRSNTPLSRFRHLDDHNQCISPIVTTTSDEVILSNSPLINQEEDQDDIITHNIIKQYKTNDLIGHTSTILNISRIETLITLDQSLVYELKKSRLSNFLKYIGKDIQSYIHLSVKDHIVHLLYNNNVAFFQSIPKNYLLYFASLIDINTYHENMILYKEHDSHLDYFYILIDGQVKLTQQRSYQQHDMVVQLTTLSKAGDYFGEISLLKTIPRIATATCITNKVILARMNQLDFNTFFKVVPSAVSDFELKLARKQCNLAAILYHPIGIDFFSKFLQLEYSDENIDFWLICRIFKHLKAHQYTRYYEDDHDDNHHYQIPYNDLSLINLFYKYHQDDIQDSQEIADYNTDIELYIPANNIPKLMKQKIAAKKRKRERLKNRHLISLIPITQVQQSINHEIDEKHQDSFVNISDDYSDKKIIQPDLTIDISSPKLPKRTAPKLISNNTTAKKQSIHIKTTSIAELNSVVKNVEKITNIIIIIKK